MKNIYLLAAILALFGHSAGAAESKEVISPLEAFCSLYWGNMSDEGALCRFTQIYHLNRTHVGESVLPSTVPVITGDRLNLLSSDGAVFIVGTETYGSKTFVSTGDGYLSFRAIPGRKLLSVRQVTLRRCFAQVEGSITVSICPE